MTEYIKKIINNNRKAKINFGKAKKEVGSLHEQLGRLEKEADLRENFWEEFDKSYKVSPVIANSAQIFSRNLYEHSDYILQSVQGVEIKDLLSTTLAISDTSSSLVVSSAAFSCQPDELSNLNYYKKIENVLSQKRRQKFISQKLQNINPSLADEYNNAWTALHTLQRDETRAPMFLMREVITQLIHHFASKERVRDFYGLGSRKDVTRPYQIKYISSKIKNPDRQKVFVEAEKSFNEVYKLLSKAHKHGELNNKETEGFLYQANALIELILDSLL